MSAASNEEIRAFRKGYADFNSEIQADDNPYNLFTLWSNNLSPEYKQYKSWHEGWLKAKKESICGR